MEEAIPKTEVLGVSFSVMSMRETVNVCEVMIDGEQAHQVITANPETVVRAQKDAKLQNVLREAALVTCDGEGIVWASKRGSGFSARERVSGYDLMLELLTIADKRKLPIYLLGTTPKNIVKTVKKIKNDWPNINVVGHKDGYFDVKQNDDVVDKIKCLKPKILFVGMGVPKQEIWIAENLQRLNVPLIIGIGGSFDVLSGALKRAPKIWIDLKLEWLYRLLQQPSRWRRMLALPYFVLLVLLKK